VRKATVSFAMSVRSLVSLWKNSAPNGRIFMKFYMSTFLKYAEEIQVSLQFGKKNGYFTWRRKYIHDNTFITKRQAKYKTSIDTMPCYVYNRKKY
jgi:hypothetical protein